MTHQIAGSASPRCQGQRSTPGAVTAVVVVGAASVGSMLPDADLAGARVCRRGRVERRVLLARVVGALVRLPLRLLVVLPHRGVTHSVFGWALASLAAGLLVSLAAPA